MARSAEEPKVRVMDGDTALRLERLCTLWRGMRELDDSAMESLSSVGLPTDLNTRLGRRTDGGRSEEGRWKDNDSAWGCIRSCTATINMAIFASLEGVLRLSGCEGASAGKLDATYAQHSYLARNMEELVKSHGTRREDVVPSKVASRSRQDRIG